MTGRSISIRSTIFPDRGVRVAPSFVLLLLTALLATPPRVVAAVLLAAALHEGGHLLALRCYDVGVEGLRLSALGAEIRARGMARLSYGQELVVTLAGPAVNLLCAPLIARAAVPLAWDGGFLFAGAHLLLGAFNLLPVPPLDGGRALYLIAAYCFGPAAGDAVAGAAGFLCALTLTALGAYLTFAAGGGAFFLLAAAGLLFGTLRQLALAKDAADV